MPSMPRPIPLLFQKVVLRLVLTSALFCIVFAALSLAQSPTKGDHLRGFVIYCLPPLTIILHHTLRLWPRKYWLVVFELIYSTIELAGVGIMVMFIAPGSAYLLVDPSVTFVLLFVISLVLSMSCFAAFVCLLRYIWYYPAVGVWSPYDLLVGYPTSNPSYQKFRQWSLVFGVSNTRQRFSTDHILIRHIRGGVAILCLLGMVLLAPIATLYRPLQQGHGSSAIKEFRAPTSSFDKLNSVQVILNIERLFLPFAKLDISVVAWAPFLQTSCTFTPHTSSGFIDVVVATCPLQMVVGQTNLDVRVSIDLSEMIDFTLLDQTRVEPRVMIWLGASDIIEDVVANAHPIQLTPGARLLGICEFSMKQKFINPSVAAIGIPEYRHFAVANVHSLSSDPQPPDLNNTNPYSSQLQLSIITDMLLPAANIKVEQEYSESTVLSGLALLGGVWTFVNGLFAAIFGSTLLLVLFGIKPLSIYGLIHIFQRQRGSLVDQGYNLLPEELNRTVGILREHLFDVGDIESGSSQVDRSASDTRGSLGQGGRDDADGTDSEALLQHQTRHTVTESVFSG